MCVANMISTLPIAIRYSAVRRQFGSDGSKELPVIEYQMQQWRLFPYLAATYIMKFFGDLLYTKFVEYIIDQMFSENKDEVAMKGQEIHAISSSAKPLAGWLARDAIQECRYNSLVFRGIKISFDHELILQGGLRRAWIFESGWNWRTQKRPRC